MASKVIEILRSAVHNKLTIPITENKEVYFKLIINWFQKEGIVLFNVCSKII